MAAAAILDFVYSVVKLDSIRHGLWTGECNERICGNDA